MPVFEEPSSTDDFPEPSALGQLLSAGFEAFVATRSKEEALTWLRMVARVLADRDEKSTVVIRLNKRDRERAKLEAEANRQAVAIFRKVLEGCVARLTPEMDDG